jgi:hypothetical protein
MNIKKQLGILALLLFTISVSAQRSAENIFRKYKNDSGVMYMDVGGDFAQFLKNDEQEIKSSVEQVKLMVFTNGKNMNETDLKDLKSSLKTDKYELLIKAKHEEGRISLYVIENGSGDYFEEIFGIVESPEYNVFARLYGKIYYEDISKLNMDMGNAGNFGDIFSGKKQ